MGLDATVPWVAPDGHVRGLEERVEFLRVDYGPVDAAWYLASEVGGAESDQATAGVDEAEDCPVE
jgi:hypothetical protein